jgi:hypothetical protein
MKESSVQGSLEIQNKPLLALNIEPLYLTKLRRDIVKLPVLAHIAHLYRPPKVDHPQQF